MDEEWVSMDSDETLHVCPYVCEEIRREVGVNLRSIEGRRERGRLRTSLVVL